MHETRLRPLPRRAIAAEFVRNSRLGKKFLDPRRRQFPAHVSQGARSGWDGASLESVSGVAHDPAESSPNLYEYCNDDPLIYTDANGMQTLVNAPGLGFPGWNTITVYPVAGGGSSPSYPIMPPTPPPAPPTTIPELPNCLPRIAKCPAAKCIARRMACAIGNTYDLNWFPASPWSQKRKGYFCHEWAWAFKYACDSERPGEFFSVKVRMCWTEGQKRTHAWVEITSRETGQTICVDDGFTEGGNFIHWAPPQCYTCGVGDMPECGRGAPPCPYDSCGSPKRIPKLK